MLIIALVYVFIVVLFEASLGYFQPEAGSTLRISTINKSGASKSTVVVRLESGEQLYVAANHWPRTWYRQALANPNVHIVSANEQGSFTAISVDAEEHDRVNADNRLGFGFKLLTGFPPRYFLRLEAADSASF